MHHDALELPDGQTLLLLVRRPGGNRVAVAGKTDEQRRGAGSGTRCLYRVTPRHIRLAPRNDADAGRERRHAACLVVTRRLSKPPRRVTKPLILLGAEENKRGFCYPFATISSR